MSSDYSGNFAVGCDSDLYPWVQDFDGVWHSRPPGTDWVIRPVENALAVCGLWVMSVRVSEFPPTGKRCSACLEATS